ncbi:MAG: hypothetical protein H6985_11290 [Pseudomonadales bacterium]|nr:hypothetical protein [Pseudomonadales bacterium]
MLTLLPSKRNQEQHRQPHKLTHGRGVTARRLRLLCAACQTTKELFDIRKLLSEIADLRCRAISEMRRTQLVTFLALSMLHMEILAHGLVDLNCAGRVAISTNSELPFHEGIDNVKVSISEDRSQATLHALWVEGDAFPIRTRGIAYISAEKDGDELFDRKFVLDRFKLGLTYSITSADGNQFNFTGKCSPSQPLI